MFSKDILTITFSLMKCFFVIFQFFTFFITTNTATSIYLPNSQYNALYSLYNSTQGINWNWHRDYQLNGYPWNFTNETMKDPCSQTYPWQGVTCSKTCKPNNCNVVILSLGLMNLEGTLPTEIGMLNQLRSLQLPSNTLTGTIPSELGQLNNLINLGLYENELTGTIPSELGQLSNITSLVLYDNQLSGTIPSELGQLKSLISLDLGLNKLTGTIPSELCQLSNITSLVIYYNQLSGTIPSDFDQLNNLQNLGLGFNQLSGTIPSDFSRLNKLINLELSVNQLTGTIPSDFGQLNKLISLDLGLNQLFGTIPSDFSQLNNLINFDLGLNQLFGTIPSELGQLKRLISLDFGQNKLTGTIPSELGQLSNLTSLVLYDNQLSGIIPTQLGQLNNLNYLFLYDNQLTGTIPPELGQLNKLTFLGLYKNQLSGTIPSELGQLNNLNSLGLNQNKLTGTIPSELSQLNNLTMFFININQLTGTISSELANLTNLNYFDLYDNQLTGTIPSELGSLNNLFELNLMRNQLTGTIPLELSQLNHLAYLELFLNLLSGTIPTELGQLTSLQYFDIHSNQITGILPTSFNQMIKLDYLSIKDNYISSTLSLSILCLPQLLYFDINNNYITSLLPDINYSENTTFILNYLDLSYNMIYGIFPSEFLRIENQLMYLNLANNWFIGSIPNSNTSYLLEILYLQNNSFTGSLPSQLLSHGNLISFIASVNCLSGDIPEIICNNKNLNQLNLDGLHSSDTCITKIASWTGASSYTTSESVGGSIPSCLFELPNLVSLHLSGNNFVGSLPHSSVNHPMGSNLTILNIANNRLTGTIPSFLLSNKWLWNIDMSFNQLKGFGEDISSITAFDTNNNTNLIYDLLSKNGSLSHSLRLKVNHLSGHIPSVWKSTLSIDLLEGNMFSCNIARNDLPVNDPLKDTYECGSDDTNTSLYVFVCLSCVLLMLFYGFNHFKGIYQWLIDNGGYNALRMKLHALTTLEKKLSDSSLNSQDCGILYDNLEEMAKVCECLISWLRKMMIWLVVFIVPMYISLNEYFSTYHNNYVWTLASSYLSGIVPALTMLIAFYITMIGFVLEWKPKIQLLKLNIHQLDSMILSEKTSEILKRICFVLLNVFLVLLINISYVLAVVQGYNFKIMTFISILLSIFKLVWNEIFLLGLGRRWIESTFQMKIKGKLLLFLSIFNNIMIPYIAEALVSPNCFYYAISNPPEIQTSYFNIQCKYVTFCGITTCKSSIICDNSLIFNNIANISHSNSLNQSEPLIIQSSYLPPFHYNYTCSSSLLSSFAYVFIYRYLISTLIIPTFFASIKWLRKNYEKSFEDWQIKRISCGRISTKKEWWEFLTRILPTFMKYEEEGEIQEEEDNVEIEKTIIQSLSHPMKQTIEQTMEENRIEDNSLATSSSSTTTITSTTVDLKIESLSHILRNLLSQKQSIGVAHITAIQVILDLTMLLSFGVLFPPLGVIIALSIGKSLITQIISFNQLIQLNMNTISFLKHSNKQNSHIQKMKTIIDEIFDALNIQYRAWHSLFEVGLWWAILVCCWFWALSLYDTLGNSQGAIVSLWILLVMGFGPLLHIPITMICNYYQNIEKNKKEKKENMNEMLIEMNPMNMNNNHLSMKEEVIEEIIL